MANLTLSSIPSGIFKVNASETADNNQARADIVAEGRALAYEYARNGQAKLYDTMGRKDHLATAQLQSGEYAPLNSLFQTEHLLYCAKKACDVTGEEAPTTFDEFKRNGQRFYTNATFRAVLQGIYQEIITPIIPRIYSEAVSMFADLKEVGFAETYTLSVGSNDIPVFQDSAWGASHSVPANRFYAKDYTLNPQPKSCEMRMKWSQLVGNGYDFGQFFANLTAGLYAKTMGMWNAALTAAKSNTALIPAGLTATFSQLNWVTQANKVAAVNNTSISNVFATGGAVALSKVLPTDVTGSTNANMDAAIASLLGVDYTRAGYLGQYMAVRLLPLQDAVVPGTQNTGVTTILPATDIYMMAGNGHKPMTIAYNRDTPITVEITPEQNASFELIFNMTIALDSVSVFASKVAHITV